MTTPPDDTWEKAAMLMKRTVWDKFEIEDPADFPIGCPEELFQPLAKFCGGSVPPSILKFLAASTPPEGADLGMVRLLDPGEMLDLNNGDCAPFCNLIEEASEDSEIQFVGFTSDGGGNPRAFDLKYGGVCYVDVSAEWAGSHDATLDKCPEYFPTLLDWVRHVRIDEVRPDVRQDSYKALVYDVTGVSNPGGETATTTIVPLSGMIPGNEMIRLQEQIGPQPLAFNVSMGNSRLLYEQNRLLPSQHAANLPYLAAAAFCELSNQDSDANVTFLLMTFEEQFSWSTAMSGVLTDWQIAAVKKESGVTLNCPALAIEDASQDPLTKEYLSKVLPDESLEPSLSVLPESSGNSWRIADNRILLLNVVEEQTLMRLQVDRSVACRRTAGVFLTAGKDCDVVFRVFDGHYGEYSGLNEPPILCSVVPYWSRRCGKTELLVKQIIGDHEALIQCRLIGDRVEFDVDVAFAGETLLEYKPLPSDDP